MNIKKLILLPLFSLFAFVGLACGASVTLSELDDGSRILYIGDVGQEFGTRGEIYSVNVDGTDIRQHTFGCTQDTPETYCSNHAPSVSPDGTRLAYERTYLYVDELTGVYTVNMDGTDSKLLIPGASLPTWSPDGEQLAFIQGTIFTDDQPPNSSADMRFNGLEYGPNFSRDLWEIFVINADGTGKRRITDLNGGYFPSLPNRCSKNNGGTCPLSFSQSLSWSPDGEQIVFGNGLYGNIYTVNVNGGLNSGLKPLLDPNDRRFNELTHIGTDRYTVRNPSWSPDGKRIAFQSRPGSDIWDVRSGQIYTVNPDGTDVRHVGNGWRPTWSPDGQYLLFWSVYDIPENYGGRNWFYTKADGSSNKIGAITRGSYTTFEEGYISFTGDEDEDDLPDHYHASVDSDNRAVWYIPAPADASVSN